MQLLPGRVLAADTKHPGRNSTDHLPRKHEASSAPPASCRGSQSGSRKMRATHGSCLPDSRVRLASCCEVCLLGVSNGIVLWPFLGADGLWRTQVLRSVAKGPETPLAPDPEARASAHPSAAWTPIPPLSPAASNSKLNRIKTELTWPREHLRLQASSPKLECPSLRLSEPTGWGRGDYYLTLLRNKKKLSGLEMRQ